MKMTARENTFFHIVFDKIDPKSKEEMNESLVNLLHCLNTGIEDQVKESMATMGRILKEIGARDSPLTTPKQEEGEEEEEDDLPSEESEEAKKRRYMHSELEECSDRDVDGITAL